MHLKDRQNHSNLIVLIVDLHPLHREIAHLQDLQPSAISHAIYLMVSPIHMKLL